MFRREFGIKIRRILFSRGIKTINPQRTNRERKLMTSGKRSLSSPFPRWERLKMKARLQGQKRAGRAEEWLAMVGERTGRKVEEVGVEEI